MAVLNDVLVVSFFGKDNISCWKRRLPLPGQMSGVSIGGVYVVCNFKWRSQYVLCKAMFNYRGN